jgi:hypothetical protein
VGAGALGLNATSCVAPRVAAPNLPSRVILDVPFPGDPSQSCAYDALSALFSFWNAGSEALCRVPQDRGVSLPEVMSILRQSSWHVELIRDSKRLPKLKDCLREGTPALVLAEVTALPEWPMSPVVRAKGYPHYMVVVGFDEREEVVFCLGLGPGICRVQERIFLRWWQRTGYPFLKTRPGGSE